MPMYDYKCNACGFMDEFGTGKHLPKAMQTPDNFQCPKCNNGVLEKQFTSSGRVGIDIIGYCYENVYGKKAWKKNLSQSEQAEVLMNNRSPY